MKMGELAIGPSGVLSHPNGCHRLSWGNVVARRQQGQILQLKLIGDRVRSVDERESAAHMACSFFSLSETVRECFLSFTIKPVLCRSAQAEGKP
jgi:hypothetical protein